MESGICNIARIPVRSDPDHQAEMVNELLYGESYTVLIDAGAWLLVRSDWDGYHGWINRGSHFGISEDLRSSLATTVPVYTIDPISVANHMQDGYRLFLSAGSRLPFFDPANSQFGFTGDRYVLPSEPSVFREVSEPETRIALLETAKQWLKTPYVWGGKSSFGTDCSGFVQTCCRICGITIPRDAKEQAGCGITIEGLEQAKAGDLAFFGDEQETITHTGFVAGNGKILHASGFVRYDLLDPGGIHRRGRHSYTHKLRLIRDIISGFLS